ncbi:hypothetical protein [Caballeronia sp. LZ035]|uniref:hypothetical protein n=1 Tax=Caballeronia sp. LZ035 TaxID=3038568 RepID=UPI0028580A38|nr:hypothetical protein [Caballeronia sp. LZ035]MDR5756352.1 hypothetical protein [Caballeronia sp. LZ035]
MAKDIDLKELASLIGSASIEFACASQSFNDISAVFNALGALAENPTLVQQLAALGARMSESNAAAYEEEGATYREHSVGLAESIRPVDAQEVKHA